MIIRGYCKEKDQESILRFIGLSPRDIYREGYMGESMTACISSFRGAAGILLIAAPSDAVLHFGSLKIVGITPAIFEQLSDILKTLRESPTLRRLFAAL